MRSKPARPHPDDMPYITWHNPPPSPQPLLEHHGYLSAAMGVRVGYNVYLPPAYREPGDDARYPVVYWLHGRGNTESSDQFPPAIVDAAIRGGRPPGVPPVIVVYVCGGQQSWYADSPDGRWLARTTLLRELIPHIDATWRTIPTRDGRAIQGMSMGGYGALKLALLHPELFSSVVAFGASFRTAEDLARDPVRSGVFQTMFGGDAARFTAEHPFTLIAAHADRVRGELGIKLHVGTEDSLVGGNRRFHEQLLELDIPHEYTEHPGVGHHLPKLAHLAGSDGLAFAFRHFGGEVLQ